MVCEIICNFLLLKLRAMAWGELWAMLCETVLGYFMCILYVYVLHTVNGDCTTYVLYTTIYCYFKSTCIKARGGLLGVVWC